MRIRQKLGAGTRINATASVLGVATAFAKTYLVAQWVPAGDVGGYALALVAIGLAALVGGLGLSASLYHHHRVSARMFDRLLALPLGAGLAAGALSGGVLYAVSELPGVTLGITVGCVAVAAGGQAFANLAATRLQLALEFRRAGVCALAARVAADALVVACIARSPDLLGLLLGLAGAGAVTALVYAAGAFPAALRRFGYAGRLEDAPAEQDPPLGVLLRLGSVSVLHGATNFAVFRLDRVIVGYAYGLGLLGQYELILQLVERPAQLIAQSTRGVVAPLMARYQARASAVRRVYAWHVRTGMIAAAPYYVGLAAFAPLVLGVLFDAPEEGLRWVVVAACALTLTKVTGAPFYHYAVARGRLTLMLYVEAAVALLRVGVLLGLALVSSIAWAYGVYVTVRILLAFAFEQTLRSRWLRLGAGPAFAPAARGLLAAAAAAGLAAICLRLAPETLESAFALALVVVVSAASYLALMRPLLLALLRDTPVAR